MNNGKLVFYFIQYFGYVPLASLPLLTIFITTFDANS